MTIQTTIRNGLPVLARGRYIARDPGCYWGDYPYPPEPECFEDIEIFWMPRNLTTQAPRPCSLELSDMDRERVSDALLNAYEEADGLEQ